MLNKIQIDLLASIFNSKEIKDYIDSNYSSYLRYNARKSNSNCIIRSGWFGCYSISRSDV